MSLAPTPNDLAPPEKSGSKEFRSDKCTRCNHYMALHALDTGLCHKCDCNIKEVWERGK